MTEKDRRRLEELLGDSEKLVAAMRREVRKAVRAQLKAGWPVVVWRNGRVETIQPDR